MDRITSSLLAELLESQELSLKVNQKTLKN